MHFSFRTLRAVLQRLPVRAASRLAGVFERWSERLDAWADARREPMPSLETMVTQAIQREGFAEVILKNNPFMRLTKP